MRRPRDRREPDQTMLDLLEPYKAALRLCLAALEVSTYTTASRAAIEAARALVPEEEEK